MVKVLTESFDKRINTRNIFVEMSYGEYLSIASEILSNNPYQRKRVNSSSTIYSQLKSDLKMGCVIPPIVLALDLESYNGLENKDLGETITNNLNNMLILDGLQRTYTMIDAWNELKREVHHGESEFLENTLRVEIYFKINRFGILYRMLTLNTGQTPMSLRHQIEILYGNLDLTRKDIKLIKESDIPSTLEPGAFKFRDTVDGFISFIQASYLPLDRSAILDTIKSLETISKERLDTDLFEEFITTYFSLFNKISTVTSEFSIQEYIDSMVNNENEAFNASGTSSPNNYMFAKSIVELFSKSQTFTGFGAALGFLRNKNIISSINNVSLNDFVTGGSYETQWFELFTEYMYEIKADSKKIGNSQRFFIYQMFRHLLSTESDSYLNLKESVELAYIKYKAEY